MEDRPDEPVIEKYNIKAAIWNLYEASDAWNGIAEEVHNIDCAVCLLTCIGDAVRRLALQFLK